MGKLADRLKDVMERTARPMGFRSGAVQAKQAQLLLLATIEGADKDTAATAIREGAHGLLATTGPGSDEETLKDLGAAAAGGIWGGAMEAGGKEDVERLKSAGAHFVLFRSLGLAGDALEVEDIDKVLEVDQEWPDMLLRSVAGLQVSAVLYRLSVDGLTLQGLLQCRRVASLVGKPLLAAIPPGMDGASMTLLRDTGVDGVIVPMASVAQLHAAIRDMPPPKKSKEHMDAVLGLGGGGGRGHSHEEEDDEDDDD